MKALSVQQPWAWLIVMGFKDIENREWPTRLRGRFAVHASKKYDHLGDLWVRRNFPQIALPESFDMGGIVGGAELLDCVTHAESRWFQGTYGFVLGSARPTTTFYQVRGQLGFFDLPNFSNGDMRPAAPDAEQTP